MSESREEQLSRLSPERRRLFEQLQARRARKATVRDAGAIVMRRGDEPRRLVVVNPSGGALFCYVPLVRALRPGFGVLGFTSQLVDGDTEVDKRLVGVGTRILAALRAETDPASCVLAGWSYGGCVAFEVARQYAQAGGAAPPVVLLDAQYPDDLSEPPPDEEELRRQFVYDLSRLHNVPAEKLDWLRPPAGAGPDAPAAVIAMLDRVGVPIDLSDAEVQHRYRIFAANASALYRYQPPADYAGTVFAVTAGREEQTLPGWRRRVTGELRHVPVAGDHYTLFVRPALDTVARTIETALGYSGPTRL